MPQNPPRIPVLSPTHVVVTFAWWLDGVVKRVLVRASNIIDFEVKKYSLLFFSLEPSSCVCDKTRKRIETRDFLNVLILSSYLFEFISFIEDKCCSWCGHGCVQESLSSLRGRKSKELSAKKAALRQVMNHSGVHELLELPALIDATVRIWPFCCHLSVNFDRGV